MLLLLRVEQVGVCSVTARLHRVAGNEVKRGGIDRVPTPGGRGGIGEDVTQMSVAAFCPDFGPLHVERRIQLFSDAIRRNGLAERGPAVLSVVFVERTKEWF